MSELLLMISYAVIVIIMLAALSLACCFMAWQIMKLWIEIRAMQKSTHSVQYIDPMQQEFVELTDEQKEKFVKAHTEQEDDE